MGPVVCSYRPHSFMEDEILAKIEALPRDLRHRAIRELKRELYRGSLYLTAKYLCGYSAITEYTHGPVIKALEAPTKRKMIVMPRGSFKSSLCSVAYPIWCLIRDPNLRILLDSELYSNSKNFLREIKMHLGSENFVSTFGIFKTEDCWNEGEIIIRQRTKILKEASITASGIGAQKTGQHYNLILSDDLNSPANSATPEGREKVVSHFKYNQSIMEPDGTMVIVGTRYAASDILGVIIENEILRPIDT